MIIILTHGAYDIHGNLFQSLTSCKLSKETGYSYHVIQCLHVLIFVDGHHFSYLLLKVWILLHEVSEKANGNLPNKHRIDGQDWTCSPQFRNGSNLTKEVAFLHLIDDHIIPLDVSILKLLKIRLSLAYLLHHSCFQPLHFLFNLRLLALFIFIYEWLFRLFIYLLY